MNNTFPVAGNLVHPSFEIPKLPTCPCCGKPESGAYIRQVGTRKETGIGGTPQDRPVYELYCCQCYNGCRHAGDCKKAKATT